MVTLRSCGELCDFREGKEVHAGVCAAGLGNGQGLEVPIRLLRGLLDCLAYWACLAVCESIFLDIWAVEMATRRLGGPRGGYKAKGAVDLNPILIHDLEFTFLYVRNKPADVVLLGVADDAILSSVA